MDDKQKGMQDAQEGIYNPPEDYDARRAYEEGRSIIEDQRQTAAYHDSVVEGAASLARQQAPSGPGAMVGMASAVILIPIIFFAAFMRAIARNPEALQGIGGFVLICGVVIGAPSFFWKIRAPASGFLRWLQNFLIWLGAMAVLGGLTMWVVGMH